MPLNKEPIMKRAIAHFVALHNLSFGTRTNAKAVILLPGDAIGICTYK